MGEIKESLLEVVALELGFEDFNRRWEADCLGLGGCKYKCIDVGEGRMKFWNIVHKHLLSYVPGTVLSIGDTKNGRRQSLLWKSSQSNGKKQASKYVQTSSM